MPPPRTHCLCWPREWKSRILLSQAQSTANRKEKLEIWKFRPINRMKILHIPHAPEQNTCTKVVPHSPSRKLRSTQPPGRRTRARAEGKRRRAGAGGRARITPDLDRMKTSPEPPRRGEKKRERGKRRVQWRTLHVPSRDRTRTSSSVLVLALARLALCA